MEYFEREACLRRPFLRIRDLRDDGFGLDLALISPFASYCRHFSSREIFATIFPANSGEGFASPTLKLRTAFRDIMHLPNITIFN
jgi:hypothetical protein